MNFGTTAMKSKKFTVIEGGRDAIERNLVIALFEGNITEVDKLSEQLNAIAKMPPARLSVLSNMQEIGNSLQLD
jgi:hypothetical protein